MLPHAATDLEAVHPRHVYIEQHDIGGGARRSRRQGRRPVMGNRNLVALHAEKLREHICDISLIIYDQHVHGRPPYYSNNGARLVQSCARRRSQHIFP